MEPHRRLEEAAEMEELDRVATVAFRPQRILGQEADLLIGVVVDALQDVVETDRRRFVLLRRQTPCAVAQPGEIEGPWFAEAETLGRRERSAAAMDRAPTPARKVRREGWKRPMGDDRTRFLSPADGCMQSIPAMIEDTDGAVALLAPAGRRRTPPMC